MRRIHSALSAAAILAVAGAAFAASHADLPRELKARQGLMTLISLNLSVVGDMARGRADYDAEAAQSAADSLVAISMISQAPLWTPGTSSEDFAESRALPAIWEDGGTTFNDKFIAFSKAASSMQAAAGGGLESLQAAMGPLGQSCSGCHDDFRQPR